jgi:hypothetical protein
MDSTPRRLINITALLHHRVVDHLATKAIEMRTGRRRHSHAQGG